MGRLAGAAQSSVELDTSKAPTDEGRESAVATLETNRRQNGPNRPGDATSGRSELDRQLDEMERANAADANNQAAAMLDGERSGGQQREGGAPMSELDGLRAAIPGEPLVDYPIYGEPPARSSFQCQAQSCPGGYYADQDSQCQVFHVCQNDGRMDTFLCPNGTIFSQQHFVCVWWWQVDCSLSRSFYSLNDAIYCNSMTLPAAVSSDTQPMGSPEDSRSSELPPLGGSASPATTGSRATGQSDLDSSAPMAQQERQQESARQRSPAGQNSIVMSGGLTLVSEGTQSSTDGATASAASTAATGGTRLGGSPAATQPTTSQQSSSSGGSNQPEQTSTQMALTNLQDDQAPELAGSAARNQTDGLNDGDMNQQQLELLSRRAA
jgi:hypothetical protein